METLAARVVLGCSGGFLLLGMLSGVWKYRAMAASREHRAPVYVDILHRASLLYSFACVVIAHFAEASPYPEWLTLAFSLLTIAFFVVAVVNYALLGLRGVDNQFEERSFSTVWGIRILAVAELVGFGGLFVGFLIGR